MEQKLRCDISIGPNLQKLRNKYGISQEKLCAILQRNGCDIGRTTYAKYENGELNVKISVLLELKKIYKNDRKILFTFFRRWVFIGRI